MTLRSHDVQRLGDQAALITWLGPGPAGEPFPHLLVYPSAPVDDVVGAAVLVAAAARACGLRPNLAVDDAAWVDPATALIELRPGAAVLMRPGGVVLQAKVTSAWSAAAAARRHVAVLFGELPFDGSPDALDSYLAESLLHMGLLGAAA